MPADGVGKRAINMLVSGDGLQVEAIKAIGVAPADEFYEAVEQAVGPAPPPNTPEA